MTLSNSFFLRGAFQHQEHLSVARHSKDIFTRWLQEEGDIVQKDHETDQSGGNVTYVVIVGIFLALVGCCCLHSMWHRVHRRFGPSTDGGPILDHNGLKNKLDPTQRRATLEAIFSETSKVSSIYDQYNTEPATHQMHPRLRFEIEISIEQWLHFEYCDVYSA